MSEHSSEPWKFYTDQIKGDEFNRSKVTIVAEGITICQMYYPAGGVYGSIAEHNAKRIVDCVNACAGLGDPAIEIAKLREHHPDTITVSREEWEAMKRDAERWAWWREHCLTSSWRDSETFVLGASFPKEIGKHPDAYVSEPENVDALVDAAIEQWKG
jgi:uncharacterized short protein YbdD (DUF466 family)